MRTIEVTPAVAAVLRAGVDAIEALVREVTA